jgi:O-antigen ligase
MRKQEKLAKMYICKDREEFLQVKCLLPKPVNYSQSKAGFSPTVLRYLVFLLVFSFWLPELRIGLSGLVYPVPTVGFTPTVGLPWVFEIIILLMLPIFFPGILLGEISFKLNWQLIWIFLMAMIAFAVIPLSYIYGFKEGQAAFGYKRFTFESLALFLVASSITWRENDLRTIVWLFIGGAAFHSFIGILGLLNINVLPIPILFIGIDRYAGLFSRPSRLSLFIGMGLTLVYTLWIQGKRLSIERTAIFLFFFLICFAGLVLSQTRSAIIAFAIVLISSTYFIGKKAHKVTGALIALSFVVGSMLIFLWLSHFWPLLLERWGPGALRYEETLARGYIWPKVLVAILYHPLGTGYDNTYGVFHENLAHAHNIFLQWGFMFGIPGLILLFYLLGKLSRQAKLVESNDAEGKNYYIAIKWAIIMFLLTNMAAPGFMVNTTMCFWGFAGVLAAYSPPEAEEDFFDSYEE